MAYSFVDNTSNNAWMCYNNYGFGWTESCLLKNLEHGYVRSRNDSPLGAFITINKRFKSTSG
jgi:hypothetical protein